MRKIILGASLMAAIATPAFAQSHRHATMPNRAAEFNALASERSVEPRFAIPSDVGSPNLTANPHPCVWAVACSY